LLSQLLLPSNAIAVSIANAVPVTVTVTITVTITVNVAVTITITITVAVAVAIAITLPFAPAVTIATATVNIFAAMVVAHQHCCHHRNKCPHCHPCLFTCRIHCPAAVVTNAAALNTVITDIAIINNTLAIAPSLPLLPWPLPQSQPSLSP
jgi:hypothetical protein